MMYTPCPFRLFDVPRHYIASPDSPPLFYFVDVGYPLHLLKRPVAGVATTQGTHEQILEFVETKFSAKDKFTWFEKGHVNGAKTREVYSFLKGKLPSDDGTADIRWNFTKFLIDHEGTPFKRFGPTTSPEEMVPDIEELIKKMEDAAKG